MTERDLSRLAAMNEFVGYLHDWVMPTAFALLPGTMGTREAKALLIAIGLQESGFAHRRQVGGPARGFWQFEQGGGVAGVLRHPVAGPMIKQVCRLLQYEQEPVACYVAIEHNDVLAVCFARLLMWVDRRALPSPMEAQKGWDIYVDNWRPGKPHRHTWDDYFDEGWRVVQGV